MIHSGAGACRQSCVTFDPQVTDLNQRLRDARLRRRFSATLVAERADVSRPTLRKVEQGNPSVTLGNYLRVLAVLGLENDLARVAVDDLVGRRFQDAALHVPRRAPKKKTQIEPAVDEL